MAKKGKVHLIGKYYRGNVSYAGGCLCNGSLPDGEADTLVYQGESKVSLYFRDLTGTPSAKHVCKTCAKIAKVTL